jgi:hypothetical protein
MTFARRLPGGFIIGGATTNEARRRQKSKSAFVSASCAGAPQA